MLDTMEVSFVRALERRIVRELSGDEHKEGLYRTAIKSQSMDELSHSRGLVQAYENVLAWMQDIVRQMNEPSEQRERPFQVRAN